MSNSVGNDRNVWIRDFEQICRRSPASLALRFQDREVSYQVLNQLAAGVAGKLSGLGVGAGSRVGFYMKRCPELLVCLAAIHKLGAVFIPLDLNWPRERIYKVCENADLAWILTRLDVESALPGVSARTVLVNDMAFSHPELDPLSETFLDSTGRAGGGSSAYILHTSGSTGEPKGVEVNHASLCNTLRAVSALMKIDKDDRFLGIVSIAFDIVFFELLAPLMRGAGVWLLDDEEAGDMRRVAACLSSGKANVVQATPSLWKLLNHYEWEGPGPIKLISTGEGLPVWLAKELLKRNGPFWNLYGPTETTLWATAKQVRDESDLVGSGAYVAIGRPIDNLVCHVLDQARRPVDRNQQGELYIGGAGLALGYVNDDAMTAARFVRTPAGDARHYRSGDRVSLNDAGELIFHGRMDRQVKVNGYRIELEEVEAALKAHRCIQDALVSTVTLEKQEVDMLVAYVIHTRGMPNKTAERFNAFLSESLPSCMLPSRYYFLQRFPLTSSGKIDYSALPLPASEGVEQQGQVRSERERVIMDIFCDVLEVNSIGLYDSFFDAGGNSMLAATLLLPINIRFNVNIRLKELLAVPPTVDTVTRLVNEHLQCVETVPEA